MGRWSAEGITEDVDLTPVIMQYRVFQPLRGDIGLSASVQLGEDGDLLIWVRAVSTWRRPRSNGWPLNR